MSARKPRPTVLLIGDATRADFRSATQYLQSETNLLTAASCAAASALFAAIEVPAPQWIVLATPQRGAFATCEVEALHTQAPLAKLVQLLGGWCEGETRTGRPLRGVTRAAWTSFVSRAQAELHPQSRLGYAGWSLPRTATPHDVALLTRASVSQSIVTGGLVAVVAVGREDYLALADALAACGCQACWRRDGSLPSEAQGIVWAGTSLTASQQQRWRQLRQAAGARPIVALLDFPRWQEVAELLDNGATTVIAKPFLLGDLRAGFAQAGLLGAAPSQKLSA